MYQEADLFYSLGISLFLDECLERELVAEVEKLAKLKYLLGKSQDYIKLSLLVLAWNTTEKIPWEQYFLEPVHMPYHLVEKLMLLGGLQLAIDDKVCDDEEALSRGIALLRPILQLSLQEKKQLLRMVLKV